MKWATRSPGNRAAPADLPPLDRSTWHLGRGQGQVSPILVQ